MKRNLCLLLCILAVCACTPESAPDSSGSGKPDTEKPADKDNPADEDGSDDSDNPDSPDSPDAPDTPDNPDTPDSDPQVEVLDPGREHIDADPVPSRPDAVHNLSCTEFFSSFQNFLDEYGNVDYVCSQGEGTSWPMVTSDGHIRFYQGTSEKKGGSYIRIRSFNGAKLLRVEAGSVGKTVLAHSVNGKADKSGSSEVAAGGKYVVEGEYNEVKIYCMGTSQDSRWELDCLKITYKGGFIEEDFYTVPEEYGPLVRVALPFTEDFEKGFPTTDKPSYYKYGTVAGRENLQWSTWYGSFSWQNPIDGQQSAQLRIYQEETDYDQDQFGHLKMEYFIENLSQVDFSYRMSEFWMKAVISYCEFGTSEWRNPQQIALSEYSQRETVRKFSYVLSDGKPVNAKIRIELDPASGYPTKGHYDFSVDDVIFR